MPRSSPSAAAKQQEAKRLRALRETLGLTYRELAKEFKTSHSAIVLWEQGDRTIPGPVLRLIEIYEERLKGASKRSSR